MILFVSTSESDVICVTQAAATLPAGFPAVTAVLAGSQPPGDGQRSLAELLAASDLAVVRILPGSRTFGDEWNALAAKRKLSGKPLLVCAGINEPDLAVPGADAAPSVVVGEAFKYFRHGGVENMRGLLLFAARAMLGRPVDARPPRELPVSGIYFRTAQPGAAASRPAQSGRPQVGILFYRTQWLSGNTRFVDALIDALDEFGCDALPVFIQGLTPTATGPGGGRDLLFQYFADATGTAAVDCLISTLSFSWSPPLDSEAPRDWGWSASALATLDVPVLQVATSFGAESDWLENKRGLSPLELTMSVALPEIDGRIATVPLVFRSTTPDGRLPLLEAPPDRARMAARMAARWAALRRTPAGQKRLAVVLHSYPPGNGRIGNGVGLDTLESTARLLRSLAAASYDLAPAADIPASGDQLARLLLAGHTYDQTYGQAVPAKNALMTSRNDYAQWFDVLPSAARLRVIAQWGEPSASRRTDPGMPIAGIRFGNVFVGIQPPRDPVEGSDRLAHDPHLPPPHAYLAFYHWVRDVFNAHAVVHMGKHGSLEWLPGKAAGLSADCFPEIVLDDVPNLYPFIVNDPGEGAQAKRRAHAVIIDHLTPAMTRAGAHGDIAHLESLIGEYHQAKAMDPARMPIVESLIVKAALAAHIAEELESTHAREEFPKFLDRLEGLLYDLTSAQIRHGLHVLGQAPAGERLCELLAALSAPDAPAGPGLRRAVSESLGLDLYALLSRPGDAIHARSNPSLAPMHPGVHTCADALTWIDGLCLRLIEGLSRTGFDARSADDVCKSEVGSVRPDVVQRLLHICQVLRPALDRTGDEIGNLLHALQGGYVPAGPSGAPTRGMAHVLPTGRNFYTVDPRALPSISAWQAGVKLGDALLAKYRQDRGAYPESIAIVLWGTAAMRTQGEDIAEVLYLLGVRPAWDNASGHVIGLDTIPAAELNRPRIDVTVKISGFFRDAFLNLVDLIDRAVAVVAALDEPDGLNYVAKHVREELPSLLRQQTDATRARRSAALRVFGPPPGGYGSGLLPLLYSKSWDSQRDLADTFVARSAYGFGGGLYGEPARRELEARLRRTSAAVKNQDNREHDIFDSDDYFQEHGGMVAAMHSLSGSSPPAYIGDSADPARPVVRTLWQEGRRVFRSRVANPKWIESIKAHGYRGASELTATVDYLFGYDATAGIVDDWMYEQVAERYAIDPAMRSFLEDKNPWALRSICERLLEAADRGLWERPPENMLKELRVIFLNLDARFESEQEAQSQPESSPARLR